TETRTSGIYHLSYTTLCRSKRGNKWAVVIYLGRDETTGKKLYRWHSGFKTKAEAERELARLVNDAHTGAYVEPEKMSVAEYLRLDRKSTRLNSSHVKISYAV